MDGVLCFTNGTMSEHRVVKDILNLYCKATCMEINIDKPTMCFHGVSIRVEQDIKDLYNFQSINFSDGFK